MIPSSSRLTESDVFVPSPEELARSLWGAGASDLVLASEEWLRAGNPRAAIVVCELARRLGYRDAAIELAEATARYTIGDRSRALELVDAVLASSPGHLLALALKARMLVLLGRTEDGKRCLLSVIERCPDFPGAQALLSHVLLPGPPYREVLAAVHRIVRPETYLEIGVDSGATLALASEAKLAIGVDPMSRPISLPPQARLYRTESDTFFATETLAGVFGGRTVDLTFIDGLHRFEFALRDFVNAERWASRDGTILLHDCLAVTALAARRERASTFWVGDVWKVLEILLEYRKDLRIHVVPTPPSGLVVVRRLDPSSVLLSKNIEAIVERFGEVDAPGFEEWGSRYPLVENREAGLAEIFS